MPRSFQVDENWVAGLPKQRTRYLLFVGLVTIVVLLLAALLNQIFLIVGLVLAAIYWYFELKYVPPNQQQQLLIEIRSDGLYQRAPNPKGDKPLDLLIPWSRVKITDVKREGDVIRCIKVMGNGLPKGARSFKLEHFEDMAVLLDEIRAHTHDTDA